jgi:hypothetical protein
MNKKNNGNDCTRLGLPSDLPNAKGSLCERLFEWFAQVLNRKSVKEEVNTTCYATSSKLTAYTSYIPETFIVEKDDIYLAIEAIESGLENTHDCLIEHDSDSGRATTQDKLFAKALEKEIEIMNSALQKLKAYPKSKNE